MANSQGIATSFKVQMLNGIHALGTSVVRAGTTADTFKAAMFLASATITAATTAYSTTGEVTGTNYTAGGVAFTWSAPGSSGTTAFTTPSADITFTNVTIGTAFDCVLLYNSTQGDKAVEICTFGSQTVTAADFVLRKPTNDASTGLLRFG